MKLPRVRFTVRRMMVLIAVLSVMIAPAVRLAKLSARRRYHDADRAVSIQIDLLRRASDHERRKAKGESDRAAKNQALSETEAGPRGALWSKAADGALRSVKFHVWRAEKYQKAADALAARRLATKGNQTAVEQLGSVARTWLATDDLSDETFPNELRMAKLTARSEHEARMGGRSKFPTIAGPRASAIEATAIWQAERALKSSQPTLNMEGFRVIAAPVSKNQPFWWKVTFIDPVTGRTIRVDTTISEPSVKDYVAQIP